MIENLERESQYFPFWVNFFLPLSENRGHIYRWNWFDLSPSYFDDKRHCFSDIYQHLTYCSYTDWHIDMQACRSDQRRKHFNLNFFFSWDPRIIETLEYRKFILGALSYDKILKTMKSFGHSSLATYDPKWFILEYDHRNFFDFRAFSPKRFI